jgi:sortase B
VAKSAVKNNGKKKKPDDYHGFRIFLVICFIVTAIVCVLLLLAVIHTHLYGVTASRQEHASLLELAEALDLFESADEHRPYVSVFDREMREINPDYVCWISIDGTGINYPVVRGNDNERYLNRTFYGEDNIYGAIFMDYRCRDENTPNIIIYGHNTRTGDMFSGLHRFLNARYITEHPVIVLKINDRYLEYEIVTARKTNINDPAYFLDFSAPGSFTAFLERNGAPLDATQIITLSTCVSAGNNDERVIVQGVRR